MFDLSLILVAHIFIDTTAVTTVQHKMFYCKPHSKYDLSDVMLGTPKYKKYKKATMVPEFLIKKPEPLPRE